MVLCRVNDCEREGSCQFTCRDCGTVYPSDERECPECGLRSCLQFYDEGCEFGPRIEAELS